MRVPLTACILAAAVLSAGAVFAALPKNLPATFEPVTGSPITAYVLFGMFGFLAVLLIYRGIRAR